MISQDNALKGLLTFAAANFYLGAAVQGAVIHNAVVISVANQAQANLDVNSDGQSDLTLTYSTGGGTQGGPYSVQAAAVSDGTHYPSEKLVVDQFTSNGIPIPVGGSVPPDAHFSTSATLPLQGTGLSFFGFQLGSGSLGFFSLSLDQTSQALRVANITYESQPNTALTVAVPEPTTFTALAMGVAGAALRRRRPEKKP